MDETTDNRLHAVVYRVADQGSTNFELSDADAEFVVIYRV